MSGGLEPVKQSDPVACRLCGFEVDLLDPLEVDVSGWAIVHLDGGGHVACCDICRAQNRAVFDARAA